MEITTTCTKPFERIILDIVGKLPLTVNGKEYILTLQDDLTKYSQAYPLPNHNAETIAKTLVQIFICKFGVANSILTDQGRDFMSNLLKEVTKLFKIKKINITAYHPQSNGALERSHHTLSEYLTHYVNLDQSDWDSWIDFAMFSYNTTPHSSTHYSPHELVFGNKPQLPSSITKSVEYKYTYDNYLDDLKLKLQKSNEIARNNIIDSKIKNKTYSDRKSKPIDFKLGDMVYLENQQVTLINQKN